MGAKGWVISGEAPNKSSTPVAWFVLSTGFVVVPLLVAVAASAAAGCEK